MPYEYYELFEDDYIAQKEYEKEQNESSEKEEK